MKQMGKMLKFFKNFNNSRLKSNILLVFFVYKNNYVYYWLLGIEMTLWWSWWCSDENGEDKEKVIVFSDVFLINFIYKYHEIFCRSPLSSWIIFFVVLLRLNFSLCLNQKLWTLWKKIMNFPMEAFIFFTIFNFFVKDPL